MDFATSLKHKRKEFSIADLIGSLDVEEKARAKDTRRKGVVGTSSANVVQKNNSNKSHNNNKKKTSKRTPQRLNKQPILRRRTREIALSAVILVISPVNVRTVSGRTIKNQQIWLLAKLLEHRGMVIYYLQFFQSVIHLNGGLIPVLRSMCVLIYPYFYLIRLEGLNPC
jgi:hypothetical protein